MAGVSQRVKPGLSGADMDRGSGPRAGIDLVSAAKAWAVLQGRGHATTKDVERMAIPVMRHRLIPAFHAEASGITREDLIRRIVDHVRPTVPMSV